MDTLGQFVAAFEKEYLNNVAGTEADPYADVPEFDDYTFDEVGTQLGCDDYGFGDARYIA